MMTPTRRPDGHGSGARSTVVVGAGIVGTIAAYELAKAGITTTLVDADAPGMGCSFGNAGAISPGAVVPLAMPGVLRSVLTMLRDPEGPLHIRPSYLPRAIPWLTRFLLAARPARVDEIAIRLHDLHKGAIGRHIELAAEIGAPELVQCKGQLHLYPDEAALAADAAAWALRTRFGVEARRLDRDGILQLEPGIAPRYTIGMYLPDHAMLVNPHRYVQGIASAFERRGGRLVRAKVERIERTSRGWSCIGDGARWEAGHVVVAAGMGSARLLRPLGVNPPLETQRGYHVAFEGIAAPTHRVVVLADRKAFTTPMEDGFRIAGTVELAGLERPPSPRRIAILERLARATFPGLDGARVTTWMGHRPCMPDTLPWIGPAPGYPGLWFAFGHGHMGVTDAPGTASRVRDGILSEETNP